MLRDFFRSVNTSGGHVAVGFLLIFVGAAFYKFMVPKGEDLIITGATLIARAMTDQQPPATDIQKGSVEVVKTDAVEVKAV